ncbi:hypothetical protein VQH23_20935 [Pararoseomonas sp. SCSIO 73927]|uniref:hypothetical protein n=1 Tax=Pararoseomonas sp. SCSIO 73927 TaxID=3114537 RepID=UPI0030CE6852
MRPTCSTPERDEFLLANWSNLELSLEALAARMNAMPGPQIAGGTTVSSMRKRLGLPSNRRPAPSARRPSQVRAATVSTRGPALHGASGVKGTSLSTSESGADLPADNGDRAEAEELFESGLFARAVAAQLQVDVGLVSCWYFAWKKRRPAQAAQRAEGIVPSNPAPASSRGIAA